MKEFIPKINIKPDRLYLVMRQEIGGYATLGDLYSITELGSYVRIPINKEYELYRNYISESFQTFREWSLSIYDHHHMTKKGWNKIYEFKSLNGVERFLKKLRLADKLSK